MSPKVISISKPNDYHLHLRDGNFLKTTVPQASKYFSKAVVMPNLVPPITTYQQAQQYKQRILKEVHITAHSSFTPLMTLYLTDKTTPQDIIDGFNNNVFAVKLYPAGATTNSDSGVTDISNTLNTLKIMEEIGMPLLVHGEVTDPQVDFFDREKIFINRILKPLLDSMPHLKVVMEHITTKHAVDFVQSSPNNVAATITPHHMLLNRNALFQKGLRPHLFCLPILKREEHRQAVEHAAVSGNSKFFLGTDSAPHVKETKECSCGCAGCFNSPVALPIYTSLFEKANSLDKLEAFCSQNGARFYGLAENSEKIKLVKEEWDVPNVYEYGNSKVVPLLAGEKLQWKVHMQ